MFFHLIEKFEDKKVKMKKGSGIKAFPDLFLLVLFHCSEFATPNSNKQGW